MGFFKKKTKTASESTPSIPKGIEKTEDGFYRVKGLYTKHRELRAALRQLEGISANTIR